MENIKELKIFYFSGTGNAKIVSQWIAEKAVIRKIKTEVVDISMTDRKNISPIPSDAWVGFCSPTHGFNFPPVMIYFILRFPRANSNKVFLINTRAGMRIKNFTLPGLSGIALLFSALVLLVKGYKIRGMRSIDLPSNWISLHPGLNKKGIESLFRIFKEVTYKYADSLFDRGKNLRALYELPIDLLLTPISLMYFIMGRFVFAKSFYASAACNNCSLCIKQCPVKAISVVDKRPYWSYTCESCMHCMNTCPRQAIETAHGYIIGLLILLGTVVQSLFYNTFLQLDINWFSEKIWYGKFAQFIFNMLLTFISLLISYRFIHYLRRFKLIDLIITYTSLTKYKFWGRYKPPAIKNF